MIVGQKLRPEYEAGTFVQYRRSEDDQEVWDATCGKKRFAETPGDARCY